VVRAPRHQGPRHQLVIILVIDWHKI